MLNVDIFKAVHDYVVFATGLPNEDVRLSRPNNSIDPSNNRGTVAEVDLINETTIGFDSMLYKNIDGDDLNVTETINAHRNLTASVKFYGNDAADLAYKTSYNLTRSGALEIFYKAGIGVLNKGQVLNLSQVYNGSFEEIRQLDIELHINHIDDLDINAINSSTIDIEFHGSTTVNEQVEVP